MLISWYHYNVLLWPRSCRFNKSITLNFRNWPRRRTTMAAMQKSRCDFCVLPCFTCWPTSTTWLVTSEPCRASSSSARRSELPSITSFIRDILYESSVHHYPVSIGERLPVPWGKNALLERYSLRVPISKFSWLANLCYHVGYRYLTIETNWGAFFAYCWRFLGRDMDRLLLFLG